MDSNFVVIPESFNLKVNNTIQVVTIKPLSIYATISVIRDLEKDTKTLYKNDLIELSKELTGKDKADFLMNGMLKYQKIDGSELLNTVEGYQKVLSIVTKLNDSDLKIALENSENQENITKILKVALDIKDDKQEVKEDKENTEKKI